MDGGKAKEVGRWRCCQYGSFCEPAEACQVVGLRGSCGFCHGAPISEHIIIVNDACKFELRVVDRTRWVVV